MTNYKSQVCYGEKSFNIQLETDNARTYRKVEDVIRACIDAERNISQKDKILKLIENQSFKLSKEIDEYEDKEQRAYYNGALTILGIISSEIKELV